MSAAIPESEWKWLGHKQHLIVASSCQFSLATHIGAFVVSTIGEYDPAPEVRNILTRLKKGEFEEIGYQRKYETMVFPVDGLHECGCPKITSHGGLECDGYNDAADAQRGHLSMCRKVAAAPGGWCQGAGFRDENGMDIGGDEPGVCSRCTWLATSEVVAWSDREDDAVRKADGFIRKAIGDQSVVYFNDTPGRTQLECVVALEKAALLAMSEGQ